MTTELAARPEEVNIGGSMAATVLGLSPWESPLSLYLRLRGEEGPKADTPAMYFGRKLENLIAFEYGDRNGVSVQRVVRTLRHPAHHWMTAHIDRAVKAPGKRGPVRVIDGNGRLNTDRILEVKTASQFSRKDWLEGVPEYYLPQALHYLAITGARYCDFAVLIGGSEYVQHTVEADPELQAQLIFAEQAFREQVLKGEPPDVDSVADAKRRWREAVPGSVIEAGPEVYAEVQALRAIDSEMKTLETAREELQKRVMAAMGDAETLTHLGQPVVTWKNAKPSQRLDYKRLAADLDPAMVMLYTETVPGSRRFILKGDQKNV